MKRIVACAALTAALALAGCKTRGGELDLSDGLGVTVVRTGCPLVEVPAGLGDVTIFNPPTSRDESAIDVVATITDVRSTCDSSGPRIATTASFDVFARRTDPHGARQVTLPFLTTMVQGGTAVVSKRIGTVTLTFADGQYRASAHASAAGYVDAAATRLPPRIRELLTRKRKAGDADAAIDPLSEPAVRAAVARASFELLVGFQLTDEQLRYNVTR